MPPPNGIQLDALYLAYTPSSHFELQGSPYKAHTPVMTCCRPPMSFRYTIHAVTIFNIYVLHHESI